MGNPLERWQGNKFYREGRNIGITGTAVLVASVGACEATVVHAPTIQGFAVAGVIFGVTLAGVGVSLMRTRSWEHHKSKQRKTILDQEEQSKTPE